MEHDSNYSFTPPQSAVEKEKIHKDYEEYRTELDPDKRRKIYDRMVRLAEAIDVPVESEALLTIGELREQSYEDHSSTVASVVPKIAKAGSSLSSGKNKGNLPPRVVESTTKMQERSAKAKERVTNLEKALDVLEKTGEWRGEEFGVIVGTSKDATFDLNTFDEGKPTNLTAEQVSADPDFLSRVRDKLEFAKDEQRLQETKARAKELRLEQNTVDIEDLTPEQYEKFKKLGEEVQAAVGRGENTELGGSVVHTGQSELDGGVLDPSRTRGDASSGNYSGNTGKLNTEAVERFEKNIKEERELRDSFLELIEAINSGKKTFRPKTNRAAREMSGLLGGKFDVYSDFDLSAVSERHSAMVAALEKILPAREARIKDLELVEQQLKDGEGGKFGFVSAYSAEKGFQTGDGDSYFGRRASSEIPTDIAEFNPGSTRAVGESRARPRKDKIYRRWMSSLRGTAYLVTDKEKITGELAPDMQGEKQIIGKVKPLFGVSAPRNAGGVEGSHKGWGVVGMGLMATAARLEKEGKEVNIENVLAALDGKPLASGQSLSSGAGMAVGSRNIVRRGSAIENYRHEYQSRIGIHDETPESARPVSGYLVHKSHIDKKKNMVKQSGSGNHGSDAIFELEDSDVVGDGLTALGEIEVVLRPEVGSRTAYGIGESINTAHRPVMLTSNNRDDISDALTNTHGVESSQRNVDSMIHLLSAGIDKDFTKVGARRDGNGRMAPVGKMDPSTDRAHEPFEAQILGGFKRDDVEGVHYPFSRIQKLSEQEEVQDAIPEKTITAKLTKLGFTKEEIAYFYSMSNGQPLTGASVQRLKEYRAAKKIKKKYESQGIGYVKFAHPKGINIENPKTYDKLAKGNEDVEKIIIGQILSEMEASMKTMLAKMRKNKANSMLGDPS